MSGQTADELLEQAFERLPSRPRSYQEAMSKNEPSPDKFWYPELGLEPATAPVSLVSETPFA